MHRSRHGVPGRDSAGAGAGVIHADDACILRPVAGAACWPAYHETISRAGAPAANGIPKLIDSLKLTTRSMRPDRRPRADNPRERAGHRARARSAVPASTETHAATQRDAVHRHRTVAGHAHVERRARPRHGHVTPDLKRTMRQKQGDRVSLGFARGSVADDVANSVSASLERQGLIWHDPRASAHGGSQTTAGGSSTCCGTPRSPPDRQANPRRRSYGPRIRDDQADRTASCARPHLIAGCPG